MANEIVLGVKLAVLFISVRLDPCQIDVSKLQVLVINEARNALRENFSEGITTDAEYIAHGVRPRFELVDLLEVLVNRPAV